MKLAESSPKRWKTPWKKEILLIMSNFCFFHNVFKGFILQTCKNQGLFGKGLTHNQTTNFRLFQNEENNFKFHENESKLSKQVENSVLVTSNFSFSQSVFKRLVSQGHQKVSLCGNGLKLFWYLFHLSYGDQHTFPCIVINCSSLFHYSAFPPFPTMFSKGFFLRIIKSLVFVVKNQELTVYHTIPIFNDPEEEKFLKHCGKRRKCW